MYRNINLVVEHSAYRLFLGQNVSVIKNKAHRGTSNSSTPFRRRFSVNKKLLTNEFCVSSVTVCAIDLYVGVGEYARRSYFMMHSF